MASARPRDGKARDGTPTMARHTGGMNACAERKCCRARLTAQPWQPELSTAALAGQCHAVASSRPSFSSGCTTQLHDLKQVSVAPPIRGRGSMTEGISKGQCNRSEQGQWQPRRGILSWGEWAGTYSFRAGLVEMSPDSLSDLRRTPKAGV